MADTNLSKNEPSIKQRHEQRMRKVEKRRPNRKSTSTSNDLSERDIKPRAEDSWIAVMGMTGAGKSTLISQLVGEDIGIGHELQSETRTTELHIMEYSPGRRIWLIDTPGFEDTFRPDSEILQELALFFAGLRQKFDVKPSGILYLHRITDIRMGGSAIKNLGLLKAICGEHAFSIIRFMTTHWNSLDGQQQTQKALQREQELMTNDQYFKPFLDHGAKLLRYPGPSDSSAKSFLKSLFSPELRVELAIQSEMIVQGQDLDKTTAGLYLEKLHDRDRQRYLKQIRDLEEDMHEAQTEKDDVDVKELAKEKQDLLIKYEKLKQEVEALKLDYAYLQRREVKRQQAEEAITKEAWLRHETQPSVGSHKVNVAPLRLSRVNSHSDQPDYEPGSLSRRSTSTSFVWLNRGTLRDPTHNRENPSIMGQMMKLLFGTGA